MNTIDNFRDPQYSFLMNSYPVDVAFDGDTYRTLEHAFQAAKTDNPLTRKQIKDAPSARKARQMGRSIAIRPTWDSERLDVMRQLLADKFDDPELREKLLATGNAELVSGGHQFWGVHHGSGQNQLGKLLMEVRSAILEQNAKDLDDNLRLYLKSCHWKRDTSGDGLFGECWTPPWDEDCQYQLLDAVIEQRSKVTLHDDSDSDDVDDFDDANVD